jgi:hypothetical protein
MTQAQTERTAGKWKLSPTDDTCIIDAERNVVAEISGDYNSQDTWPLMEANARFIVTACNAHDELVAALREIAGREFGPSIHDAQTARYSGWAVELARAALASAEAGQ